MKVEYLGGGPLEFEVRQLAVCEDCMKVYSGAPPEMPSKCACGGKLLRAKKLAAKAELPCKAKKTRQV